MTTMWDALTGFTKELFGCDVEGGGLPELVHANRVILTGGLTATFNEANNSVTVTGGDGGSATNVTASVDGTLNVFPAGEMRLAGSDGTTAGGEWSVKNKAFLDAALGNNAIGLPKLHGGSASNQQILRFNSTSGNWEPSNEQSIPSIPSVPVTSVTGTGVATVTHEGTVWNVYVPDAGEPAAATVVMGPSISCMVIEGDDFDPTAPGDYIGGGQALVGKTFFYMSTGANQGPYVVTNQTPGSVVAARDASWTGVKDLSVKYMWPVVRANDTAGASCLVFTAINSGTVTVGTGNIQFYTTLDQYASASYESYVEHAPCKAHATTNIADLTHCPSTIDGIEFPSGAVNSRIFLSKQTSKLENGPWVLHGWNAGDSTWELARPSDWDYGAILRSGTTHRFQVFAGQLWPEHIIELYIGASMFIGDGDQAGGAWNVTARFIPDCDVVDETIAAGDGWEYTPRGASETNRKACRVTGSVVMGEGYTDVSIFTGVAVDAPLDEAPVAVGGEYSGVFRDDSNGNWYAQSSATTLVRDTTTKYQGTSSWLLGGSGEGTPANYIAKRIFLPANSKARIRVQAREHAALAGRTGHACSVRLGTVTQDWVGNTGSTPPPNDLGSSVVYSWAWSGPIFYVAATTEDRFLALSLYGSYTPPSTTVNIGYIDAVQFAHTVDQFSDVVYVDALYAPRATAGVTFLPGDTQDEQLIDSTAQFGDTVLCNLGYSAACQLHMSALNIERQIQFTIMLSPWSEEIDEPGLPHAVDFPVYPY